MVLKYHMQHYKATGFQNDKIQAAGVLKCQYLIKCWTEFSYVQSEWSAKGVASNLCHFFHQLTSKMAASAITKNSKNIKKTISHELPYRSYQNMCHTDAFIEFLMWRHKASAI